MKILNLKKKSANKFIQNQLKKTGKTKKVVPVSIEKVGIIADLKLWEAFDFVKDLEERLLIPQQNFKVILINSVSDQTGDHKNLTFSEKDLGMFGKIKNLDVFAFTEKKFDLLVNYSSPDDYLTQLLILKSKAKLKAGFFKENVDLYDISIKTQDNKILVFNEELGKYLKIMGFIKGRD
ncbi:MAG: hypothetical protein DSY82_06190 [Flavobacteriia bacterium]|nr:MAG: hypothetical protein DSY82_06190 [Flavobacteriia bacterium]